MILRAWQLFGDASLWLDELALVRNVAGRQLSELLFHALDFGQMAPAGFLAVSRALWLLAPSQDWILRIVPFAASAATMPLIYMIGRRLLSPEAAVGATSLVALSPPLIVLAGVVKQYSVDMFVVSALLLGGLSIIEDDRVSLNSLTALGIAGGALVLFSFPGVITAFLLGTLVVLRWFAKGIDRWPSRAVALGSPLAVGSALATAHALQAQPPEMGVFLADYWQEGFHTTGWTAPAWAMRQMAGVWDSAFLSPYPWPPRHNVLPTIMVGLSAIGAGSLTMKRRWAAPVVLAPIIAAVVAGMAGLYPLAERLSLFLTPSLALLTSAGAATLAHAASKNSRPLAAAAASLPVLPVALALAGTPPPLLIQETRPLLEEISREWTDGDILYSYFAANQAIAYYGPRFGISSWRPGVCTQPEDVPGQLSQIDELAGHPRVWVLFSHVLPQRRAVAERMLSHLRAIGLEKRALLDHQESFGTAAYLFDLSTSGASRPVGRAEGAPDQPAPSCGRGPEANWRARALR